MEVLFEYEIPVATLSKDKSFWIMAEDRKKNFLTGRVDTIFGHDYNPSIEIQLARNTTAALSGSVFDSVSGAALSGVIVSVVGFAEKDTTDAEGLFKLQTHDPDTESVEVYFRLEGYNSLITKLGIESSIIIHLTPESQVESPNITPPEQRLSLSGRGDKLVDTGNALKDTGGDTLIDIR